MSSTLLNRIKVNFRLLDYRSAQVVVACEEDTERVIVNVHRRGEDQPLSVRKEYSPRQEGIN